MLGLIICIITIILLILSILFLPTINFGKIKLGSYWFIAMLGAIVLLLTKSVSLKAVISAFTTNNAVNPLKILVLFITMTILSIFLDEVGFFKYLATTVAKKLKGSQTKLFFGFYTLISLLTIFTSNDIIILTFTPFICYYAKNTKINPIPYLISEFVAANTWSMALIIGNPTNIYLSSAFGIDFITYLKIMILPTLAGGITSLIIVYLLFRKSLNKPMESFDETVQKPNKFLLITGLTHLIVCIIFLAISSYINLEMYLITLTLSISLLIITTTYLLTKRKTLVPIKATLIRTPWNLIPFVISMFIIVLSLNENGYTKIIGDLLNRFNPIYSYGLSGALFANLINNIPMSVLYSNIITTNIQSIYASIIASNIAAFITPIGALAGIMWMSLLKTYSVNFSFKSFMKYGIIIGIPTLLMSLSILYLILL